MSCDSINNNIVHHEDKEIVRKFKRINSHK